MYTFKILPNRMYRGYFYYFLGVKLGLGFNPTRMTRPQKLGGWVMYLQIYGQAGLNKKIWIKFGSGWVRSFKIDPT